MSMTPPEVFLRLRPPNTTVPRNFDVLSVVDQATKTITCSSAQQPSKTFKFQDVFEASARTTEIFEKTLKPLINDCFDGFNVSVAAIGTSKSGKSYTINGSLNEVGILSLIAEGLVGYKSSLLDATVRSSEPKPNLTISFQAMEINGGIIRDLLLPFSISEDIKLVEDATNGLAIEGLTSKLVRSTNEANSLIQQINKAKISDSILSGKKSNTIYRFTVTQSDAKQSIKSFFSVVDMCSSEYYFQDQNKVLLGEGVLIGSTVLAPYSLIDGNTTIYECTQSVITHILADELGGNCKTKFILHFDANDPSKVNLLSLQLSEMIRKMDSCPVINNANLMLLLQKQRVF